MRASRNQTPPPAALSVHFAAAPPEKGNLMSPRFLGSRSSHLPLLAAAATLAGCLSMDAVDDLADDVADAFACGTAESLGSRCVTTRDPLAFNSDHRDLAVGSWFEVGVVTHQSLPSWSVESSDPAVVAVETRADAIVLHALGEGVARVKAFSPSGRELAALDLTAERIAAVELRLPIEVTGLDEAVAGIAGVSGGADWIEVVYRAPDGRILAGRGLAELTIEGELSPAEEWQAELRLSAFRRSLRGNMLERHAIAFHAAGTGRLVARADGLETAIDVEVIEHPAAIDIALSRSTVQVSDGFFAGLRGWSASGAPAGGLTASWQATPEDVISFLFWSTDAGEVWLAANAPGQAEIRAETAAGTAVRPLEVLPEE
jgi:hypothetical protein